MHGEAILLHVVIASLLGGRTDAAQAPTSLVFEMDGSPVLTVGGEADEMASTLGGLQKAKERLTDIGVNKVDLSTVVPGFEGKSLVPIAEVTGRVIPFAVAPQLKTSPSHVDVHGNVYQGRVPGSEAGLKIFGHAAGALSEHHGRLSKAWGHSLVAASVNKSALRADSSVKGAYDRSADFLGKDLMAPVDIAVEPSAEQPWHRLLVWVKEVKNAQSKDWFNPPDMFVTAEVKSHTVHGLASKFKTLRVGKNKFDFDFDDKGLVLFRPGLQTVTIKAFDKNTFTNNDLIVTKDVPIPAFSADGGPTKWVSHTISFKGRLSKEGTLRVKLRVLPWAYKIADKAAMDETALVDEVIAGNKAVLSTRLISGNTKAVVWVIGRNDAPMHPHAFRMLASLGFDLYVLSYRMNGATRKHRLFTEPRYNSHCTSGRFNEYFPELDATVAKVQAKSYGTVLGYAHSTGAPVLLTYLMSRGDGPFAGYIFNAPFLNWGYTGVISSTLLSASLVCRLPSAQSMPGKSGGGPSGWSLALWSQFEFDPAIRPLYKVAVTAGFACGASRAHEEIRAFGGVTTKPYLVISATGDDVLEHDDTVEYARDIGPDLTVTIVEKGRHDVLLSYEPETVWFALEQMCTYMVAKGWAQGPCDAKDWLSMA